MLQLLSKTGWVSRVLPRPASRCSSCWRCPAWCNPNCRSRDGWICYRSWDVVLIIPISLVFIHLDVRTGRANYGYEAMSVMRFQWASGWHAWRKFWGHSGTTIRIFAVKDKKCPGYPEAWPGKVPTGHPAAWIFSCDMCQNFPAHLPVNFRVNRGKQAWCHQEICSINRWILPMLVDVDEHNFCGAKHEASESLCSR